MSKKARLEAFVDEMGKVPDDEIAAKAGVSRGVVGAFRRMRGIPAYTGYLFQKGHEPLTGAKAKPDSRPRPEPKARESAPARRGRIDAFAHLVGAETDGEVAEKAGVSRSAVAAWRKRHGVPAAVPRGYHRPEDAPSQPASPPTAAPSPRPAAPAPAQAVQGVAQAWELRATSAGQQHRFFVIGAGLVDACSRAEAFIAARPGVWRIDEIRLAGDAVP